MNCLIMSQLKTFLADPEAVLNSRPFVYIREVLNDRRGITLAHFFSKNMKTGTHNYVQKKNL